MTAKPVDLPEEHGFHHGLGAEDRAAVAKEYAAPETAAGPTQFVRTVYHNGRSAGLQKQALEFEYQLDGQYSILAQMPAKTYADARDLFKRQGRQGAAATQRARTQLENRLTAYRAGFGDLTRAQAREWARAAMKQVAILHNPDQILGGHLAPSRDDRGTPIPGDHPVNSSLGSQNRTNAEVIDAAADRQIESGNGHLPMRFQVVLTNRRRNIRRLRAQQPPPALQRPAADLGSHQHTVPTPPSPSTPLSTGPPPAAASITAADIRQFLNIRKPAAAPRRQPGVLGVFRTVCFGVSGRLSAA
ncbi:polymorphic toxin type 15 domain-containing protein [Actinomyces howellii]|uniref:Novel toxin 15 domain-containing protein n=1 Tax=Actinomyces howellii TaxID=52771 RepID=A0A3S4RAX4_9ACTO|nr:polymorphic toxin type 15 domain-containing protein [Actinomyces howellii]VEG28172.1 Uncharacterised protein [Actinomyces howellii]